MSDPVSSTLLLEEVEAAGYGEIHSVRDLGKRTFQARGQTSAGAGAAVIKIWGSNFSDAVKGTDVDWKLLGTISLTLGTTRVNDGFAMDAAWRLVKAELDSISGTDAEVSVAMGG